MFKLVSKFTPSGDQPEAIRKLVEGIKEGKNIKYYLVQQEQEKLLLLVML